jgi:hypothetical protein
MIPAPSWSGPAAEIWALTSGYSSKIRAAKALVMLQVYVDDSTTDTGAERRLFLAGYMNTAERWVRFSEAWQAELDAHPAIEYLKMSEANNLSGQFRRWSETDRDEKLRGLARVIRHFGPRSIHSSISRSECKQILEPVAPYGFSRPYFYCFQYIIISLANAFLEQGGPKVPIDFIFDEQGGVGDEARRVYRIIRDGQPAPVRAVLALEPIFRDEKLVLPLQAADMLAWHVRRNHLRDPNAFQVPSLLSADGYHMASDFDAAHLKRIADGYAKIPGTQALRAKSAWKKAMLEIQRIEEAGQRPSQRNVRFKNTITYWRRRGGRMLSRLLARLSSRN